MATPLSRTFKSLKPHSNSLLPFSKAANSSHISSNILPQLQVQYTNKPSSSSASTSPPKNPWAVYLILSTNPPIKTYVGVTNNFSRRLKQHNGELVGGAKASSAGRPWTCACLIQGFMDKSKVTRSSLHTAAYQFESKWKSISRKLPRKRRGKNQEGEENSQQLLLLHRYAALNQLKDFIDCSLLEISWLLNPT